LLCEDSEECSIGLSPLELSLLPPSQLLLLPPVLLLLTTAVAAAR
jgi:hypothetical protein